METKDIPASGASGTGTETTPGASGTGASFEKHEEQTRKLEEAHAKDANDRSPVPNLNTPVAERPGAEEAERIRREASKQHSAEVAAASKDTEGRAPENIRTEFAVPPGRFPDESPAATDPPMDETLREHSDRATSYVGEFKADGSYSRQPSLDRARGPESVAELREAAGTGIVDNESTGGRPAPSPDTPGQRNRVHPAPSDDAKRGGD